jgi:GGDEF domain-containing protein
VNLPPSAERVAGGTELVHAVLIGGGPEALEWVPRLFRDPQINLLGLLPAHPADLVLHLDAHGYALCDPGPLRLFADVAQLAELARLDLIIDTSLDPSTVRRLADAGLEGVPRVNSGALQALLARPPFPNGGAIPDRGAFARRVTQELGRAFRHGRTLGMILVEVGAGGRGEALAEAVVDQVSQAIEQSLRIEDVVAYLPHGLFGVLLPETGEATRHVAARLTSNLAELRIRPGSSGEPGPRLRQATGWAWFPQDAKTAQALMDRARSRMGPAAPPGEPPT